jgi:ABC-type phosphate transport system substrate-binding protein
MRTLLILALLAFAAPASESPVFAVVVNEKSPAQSISRAELSQVFLKRTSTWEGGENPIPIEQSELRVEFIRAVHKRSAQAIDAYWQQQIFSGREVPPVEKSSDEEVLEFVANHPAAIGYVTAGATHRGVKVIGVRE